MRLDYSKAKETKYFKMHFGQVNHWMNFSKVGTAPKGDSERILAGMTEWRRSHRPDGVLITGVS